MTRPVLAVSAKPAIESMDDEADIEGESKDASPLPLPSPSSPAVAPFDCVDCLDGFCFAGLPALVSNKNARWTMALGCSSLSAAGALS